MLALNLDLYAHVTQAVHFQYRRVDDELHEVIAALVGSRRYAKLVTEILYAERLNAAVHICPQLHHLIKPIAYLLVMAHTTSALMRPHRRDFSMIGARSGEMP